MQNRAQETQVHRRHRYRSNIHIIIILGEEKERRQENIQRNDNKCSQLMASSYRFKSIVKNTKQFKYKKTKPKYFIVKLLKTKNKGQKLLKSARKKEEKKHITFKRTTIRLTNYF